MPKHPDFDKIYVSFVDRYGEKGEEVYHRWLNKMGLDDTMPLKGQKAREGPNWIGSAAPVAGVLVRGRALHPVKTHHPDEWPEVRVYLEEELADSAPTLAGKSLVVDHFLKLPPPNRVIAAWYGDGAIEYIAEVDEEIAELIMDGAINKCSVEFDWEKLERVDGVAPRGIEFTGLSLLRDLEPGDIETSVEVWEGIFRNIRGVYEPPDGGSGEGADANGAPLVEGVIEPDPAEGSGEVSIFDELLGLLPERIPMRVGYFAASLVGGLRSKLLELRERYERGELRFD